MSFTNLSCQNFGLTNPVTVTLNGQGVAIAATFNTSMQTAPPSRRPTMPGTGQRTGRRSTSYEPLGHVRTLAAPRRPRPPVS